jgi:YfiH family protein
LAGTDGFVTNEPGVVLSSYYADCVPLFIVDPVQRVVGLAHGGWKGTVKRIGGKTIETMNAQFGTQARDCLVGIGPSEGQCCYEVDEQVVNPLRAEFPQWEQFVQPKENGRWNLDLWAVNRQVFLDAGVPAEQIEVSGRCTACQTDLFFSYRAEQGKTGRMASMIAIKPSDGCSQESQTLEIP